VLRRALAILAVSSVFAASAAAQDLAPGRMLLSPAQVDAAASQRLGKVKSCYRSALSREPALFGVLAIGFRVSADGKVGDRWIAMSTVADPVLETCALAAFEGLSFPAPGGDGAEVRFGMLLSTDPKEKPNKLAGLPDRAKLEEDAWKKSIQSGK
jgi:hypothetical protein